VTGIGRPVTVRRRVPAVVRRLAAPRTLRGRLALSAMAAGSLAVVLLTVAFDLLLVHRLGTEADAVVRARAQAAVTTVEVRPDGSLELADAQGDTALDSGIWVYRGQDAVKRAPGSQALQDQADALIGTAGQIVRRKPDDSGSALAPTEFASVALRLNGRQVGTVVAAISLDPYRRSTRVTIAFSVALDAVLIGLVLLLGRLVAARALQPVEEMTRQAGQWSIGDSALRFGRGTRPAELEELAGGLDDLLDRLAAALRREQQVSAEISHELRTPLAGIVAETELFTARPRSATQAAAAIAAIGGSARRMERILDTLLSAARAESSQVRGRCDARLVVEETVAGLPARIPVEVTGDAPAWSGVDAEVLERVLAPLLENAQRYAVSRVEVTVGAAGPRVQLRVLDDGPGVPEGSQEEVFQPGRRLAPSDGHGGAGLGLALARRLAVAAGGDLRCTAGPGGSFTVELPRG